MLWLLNCWCSTRNEVFHSLSAQYGVCFSGVYISIKSTNSENEGGLRLFICGQELRRQTRVLKLLESYMLSRRLMPAPVRMNGSRWSMTAFETEAGV
jgi:hypothetical protein